jgi:plasmid maintenance system antidote protein VapI
MVSQIREAVRRSGRSLGELSRATGVGTDRISRFMRGERTLTLPAAAKLCEALGLELTPKKK